MSTVGIQRLRIRILLISEFRKRVLTFFPYDMSKLVSKSLVLNPSKRVHNSALVLHIISLSASYCLFLIATVNQLFKAPNSPHNVLMYR